MAELHEEVTALSWALVAQRPIYSRERPLDPIGLPRLRTTGRGIASH